MQLITPKTAALLPAPGYPKALTDFNFYCSLEVFIKQICMAYQQQDCLRSYNMLKVVSLT